MKDYPDSGMVTMMVELACRAPSVHNSQPWRWSYHRGRIDLYTDRSRLLGAIDASGRQMTISCGAALDHLETAATSFRWSTEVDLMTNPAVPQHVASVDFAKKAIAQSHAFDLLSAISHRRSDRRPFGPISVERAASAAMRAAAYRHNTTLTVLSPDARESLAEASRLSAAVRRYDPTYQAELRWWAGHSFASSGIPAGALVDSAESEAVGIGRRFPAPGMVDELTSPAASEDQATVLLLSTETDSRQDWLRSGRALSAILLEAQVDGLATCTLTHLTEQSGSRAVVGALAAGSGVPQILVRIGTPGPGAVPAQTPRLAPRSVLTAV